MTTPAPSPAAGSGRPFWIMSQQWNHLLFASWPFAPETLRPHVPANIEFDTYDGKAWLSIVPMHMQDLHFRWLPPIPGTSDFPEINMRTYVHVGDQRGVFFFSIDAASHLGAFVARNFFHTPYEYAKMSLDETGGRYRMESHRSANSRVKAASLVARYRPIGTPAPAEPGSLGEFLTNRDAAIAESNGKLYMGPVFHPPWQLSGAEAEFELNTLPDAVGITLPKVPPELHFSLGTETHLCLVEPMAR